MAWADYKTPTIEIPGAGPVRGLGLDDIGQLIANNLDEMLEAADLYVASTRDVLATGNTVEFITMLVKKFPELATEVISIAADEPKVKSMKLGLGIQMAALSAITSLTVQDAGGLGNLSATLSPIFRKMVTGTGPVSRSLKDALSKFSTTAFEKTPTS